MKPPAKPRSSPTRGGGTPATAGPAPGRRRAGARTNAADQAAGSAAGAGGRKRSDAEDQAGAVTEDRPKKRAPLNVEAERYRRWYALGAPRYVVGVDLGTIGGGVVIDCHDLGSPPLAIVSWGSREGTEGDRLWRVHGGLARLLASVPVGRAAVAYERVYRHRSLRDSDAYGAHRGILVMLATQLGYPLVPVSVQRVKVVMAGNARADKGEVTRAAQLRYPGVAWTEHTADALGVATPVAEGWLP